MSTTQINVKVKTKVKTQAQKVADEFGFSLSSLINAYLQDLVRTKTVNFSLLDESRPTKYALDALEASDRNIKAGRVSPGFDTAEEAIAWLKNPNRKYANEIIRP